MDIPYEIRVFHGSINWAWAFVRVPVLRSLPARRGAGDSPCPQSPECIIGFESDGSELRFVLSNLSEEAVTSVIIGNTVIPCETSPGECGEWTEDYPRYRLLIAPHATIVLTPDIDKNNYPWLLVAEAKNFGTQYIQQQFGIAGVYFQDGTTWPMPFDRVSRGATFGDASFDRELVKSTARTCSRDADVRAAWDQVDDGEIAFAHGLALPDGHVANGFAAFTSTTEMKPRNGVVVVVVVVRVSCLPSLPQRPAAETAQCKQVEKRMRLKIMLKISKRAAPSLSARGSCLITPNEEPMPIVLCLPKKHHRRRIATESTTSRSLLPWDAPYRRIGDRRGIRF